MSRYAFDSIEAVLADAKRDIDALPCPAHKYTEYHIALARLVANQLDSDSLMAIGNRQMAFAEGDAEGLVVANYLKSYAYFLEGDWENSHPYATYVAAHLQDVHSSNRKEMFLTYLGREYTNYFQNMPEREPELDSALAFAKESIALARRHGDLSNLAESYVVVSMHALSMNQWDMALASLDSVEANYMPEINGDLDAKVYLHRADVYSNMGRVAEAIELLEDGIQLVAEENASLRRVFWRSIYRRAKAIQDFPKALAAMEEYKRMEDSLFTREKARNIRVLEARFNKADQDRRIAELNQAQAVKDWRIQQLYSAIVTSVAVAILVVGALAVRHRRRLQRSRQALAEAEQRLNRARINPHFFFNVLTILQGLAMEPGRSTELTLYLARYARLMRITLESTYSELIPLEHELRYLEDFLAIKTLHDHELFTYKIDVQEDVDAAALQVPSLLLQPLVENAIEHGFRPLGHGGVLHILVGMQGEHLHVVVEDNGHADGAKTLHAGFPSRASQIIDDRLMLLNNRYRRQGNFAIRKTPLARGYRVDVQLPCILQG